MSMNFIRYEHYFLNTNISDIFSKYMSTYYVFNGRVTLFFVNNFLTQRRITMKFLHNFF